MHKFQDTLIAIYDAAFSSRSWVPALDNCADFMSASGSVVYQVPASKVVGYRMQSASSLFQSHPRFFEDYSAMIDGGGGSDFDLEGMTYVHSRPAFRAHLDQEIYNMGEGYTQRPEVKYVSERTGLTRRCAISLSDDPVTLSGVLFLYSGEPSRGKEALQRQQKLITPHLSKSLELYRLTHELRRRYNAVLTVLDRIAAPVLVVDENSEIIIENAAASQLLDLQDGVFRSRGQVKARSSETEGVLRQKIKDVSATAKGESDQAGAVVRIPRRGTSADLIAVISPLRDAEMELEKGVSGALVTIIDTLKPTAARIDLVVAAYGLSKAEARVAEHVLIGRTNSEIADRLNVSSETVKTQLSSIFIKSGCKGRIPFIWSVFQLVPPVD